MGFALRLPTFQTPLLITLAIALSVPGIARAQLERSGRRADSPTVLFGPELEVQEEYSHAFLDAIDWPAAENRWALMMEFLSPGIAKSPQGAALQKLHSNFRNRAYNTPHWTELRGYLYRRLIATLDHGLRARLSAGRSGGVVPLEKLKPLITEARHSPKLALKLLDVEKFLRSELGSQPDLPPPFDRSLFTLAADTKGEYLIHRDQDVFELTRDPPLGSVAELKTWFEGVRKTLGIPYEVTPFLSLNPHVHVSRLFAEPQERSEVLGLTLELRVLTMLVTIEQARSGQGLSAPKPLYGGMNSINSRWRPGMLPVELLGLDGNVRNIRDASGGEQGRREIRQEFRSLAGLGWNEIYAFLGAVEELYAKSPDLASMRRGARAKIAEHFSRTSPEKLAAAWAQSVLAGADEIELREFIELYIHPTLAASIPEAELEPVWKSFQSAQPRALSRARLGCLRNALLAPGI